MTAGSGTWQAGAQPCPLGLWSTSEKGFMTRLCQSMRTVAWPTAACDGSQSRPGDPCAFRVRSQAASPEQAEPSVPARSCPLDPPGPRTASSDLSVPRAVSAHRPKAPSGRPRLLEETQVEIRAAKPKGSSRPTSQLGQWRHPHRGCLSAADTHVWQEGEALGTLSPPDRSGHTPRVCLATRPRGKIRLSPSPTDRCLKSILSFKQSFLPPEPGPAPPGLEPVATSRPLPSGCWLQCVTAASGAGLPGDGLSWAHA